MKAVLQKEAKMSTAIRWARGGLLLALVAVGCAPPTASVSGTVTFKGQPLPSGTVLFHGADGRVEHSLIDGEGKYTVVNAPLGQVRITVQAHAAAPPGLPSKGGKPPAAPAELATSGKETRDGKFVAIPPRYLDPDRSRLTCTVSAGPQTHTIELHP